MQARDEIKKKLTIVFVIFLACTLVAIGRIISLQFFQRDIWAQRLSKYESAERVVKAERGNILDCQNKLLASSIPSYEIYMDMRAGGLKQELFYKHIDSLSICLSTLIKDKSIAQYSKDLKSAYHSGKRYYRVIKRRVSYTEFKEISNFPLYRLSKNTSGFIAEKIEQRKLPFGLLAARTIGSYSHENNRGTIGIENSFDNELKGVEGSEIRKKVSGNWVSKSIIEPIPGKDVKTTIDIEIQDIVETALLKQMQKHRPAFGTAIVMDVKTGDIKAIANLGKMANGNYWEKYNYAIGERMEPGSTFKLASIMVALEDGVISLNDTIDTGNGKYKFHGISLNDSKEGGYGKISIKEAFEHSSNIGIAKIIHNNYKDDPKKFVDRLYSMSLNEKLDLDIKGEREPYIKYPSDKSWSGISLPWMSMGYEVALLPLHTLTFYNAVANDGVMVKPRIVSDIMQNGKSIKEFDNEVINSSICSKKTINEVKTLLEGVVENGTAMNLKETHLKIAGKTGTARVADNNKGYGDGRYRYRASFCGYFPADKPKYSCIVLVENPSGYNIYGNVVAGTVFREIADKIYARSYDLQENIEDIVEKTEYKVPISQDGNSKELIVVFNELNTNIEHIGREEKWSRTYNKNDHIEIKGQVFQDNVMPNVRGMGAKDAVFLLENMGLRVKINGSGTVKYQSIQAGQYIRRGNYVTLELS